MNKKLFAAVVLSVIPALAGAAGGHGALQHAGNDLSDKASLQRGARLFVNYCLSCHSAAFMRYNRMGKDLGLTDDQVKENLMFASDKIGETMQIAMRSNDAREWFGAVPPDLSLIARSRGTDWLYTYLLSFYDDPTRPWGVNNLVFPQVGMPHVLWDLQGRQAPVYTETKGADGGTVRAIERLQVVSDGKLSEAEYQQAARDLVNFLEYTAEPVKLERQQLGVWVLAFLAVFFVLAYALKKEYWKDIH